ncbi:ATP-binding protein [Pseudomonas putida]|nr:ATP-binding protein [Pseudomonas putida]
MPDANSTVDHDPELATDESKMVSSSPQTAGFQLLRVILVDGISPGKIVNFELQGGAVLTGDNGRGKTSYLNLIPMFYGANPNSLVSKGKDSFIDYYLPRSTSYIVFEYRHADGQNRLAVAYSNSTGDKVFFRFVRQGFDQKMFVADDGSGVSNSHFRARLSELKIKCSQHQIETYSDYRAVIQFSLPKAGDRKQKAYLRDLCADYAFTSYNKALTNVDRLSVGMFSRTANFEVLQSIVVESIFDHQTTQSINIDRSKIENWPRNFRAYNDAMALEPTYQKALQDKQALDHNLESLCGLREQVSLLMAHLDGEEKTARIELSDVCATREKQKNLYGELLLGNQETRMKISFQRDNLTEAMAELDQKKAEYDELGIADKRRAYENKKSLDQTHQALKKRYETLTESNLPIVAKFDKLKADISVAFGCEIAANATRSDAVRERYNDLLKKSEELLTEQEAQLEAVFEEKRSTILKKQETLSFERGACQQNLINPQVPADLMAELERADREVTDKRLLSDVAAKSLREKEGLLSQAKIAHEQALSALSVSFEQAQIQSQNLKQVIKDNTPDPDSLLAFLRDEIPGWKGDIARVIRPDILHRTDLSPAFDTKGGSLFGLSLKLENLDATREADVESLAQLIRDEERKLELIQAKYDSGKVKADGLEGSVRKAEAEKNAAAKAAMESKSSLQVCESQKLKAQHETDRAKKSAKDLAQRALDEVTEQSNLVKKELTELEDRDRVERLLRRTQRQNKQREINAEMGNELLSLATGLKTKELKRDRDLIEMDAQCEQALRNEGVDAESLSKLNSEISEVAASIKALQDILPLLQTWVPWERDVYSNRPKIEMSLHAACAQLETIEATIAEVERQHVKDDGDLADTIVNIGKKLDHLGSDTKKANSMAEKLKIFSGAVVNTVFDATWTADSLNLTMGEWLTDLAKNYKSIDQSVSALRKCFELYVNSGVHGFYDSYRQNHDMEKSVDYMGLFSSWFEGRHQEVRSLLRSTATVFSDEVVQFHQKLKTFSEHLARFNRDLQEGLETTNSYFQQISGLVINIHSSVDELKSWGIIKSLVDSRASWINGDNTIPGNDFLESLEDLLGQWDVKNGITADLKHLVNIRGEVIENGNLRKFKNSEEFNNLSSNGLSYLILIVLFVGFWKKIKKDSPVNLVWALDELKVISSPNIDGLMRMLNEANITLASAFPDPEVTTLSYFRNAYTIDPHRRLITYKINRLGSMKEVKENV